MKITTLLLLTFLLCFADALFAEDLTGVYILEDFIANSETVIDAYSYNSTEVYDIATFRTIHQPVLNAWNAAGGLPSSPNDGDRWGCAIAGNGWTVGYIYEYDSGSTSWVEEICSEDDIVRVTDDSVGLMVEESWYRCLGTTGIGFEILGTTLGIPSQLGDLSDVSVPSPNPGDVLTWDGTYSEWTSEAVAAGGGGTSYWEKSGTVIRSNSSEVTYSTDDFVFGSSQLADDGDGDHDARFWYDKSKGAFRAGRVPSTVWDDANVGNYSTAFGYNTTAKGGNSFSAGDTVYVAGEYTAGFGRDNSVYGSYGGVFGQGNTLTTGYTHGFISGNNNTLTGNSGACFGNNNTVYGFSFSAGKDGGGTGLYSASFGENCDMAGDWSIAAGNNCNTTAAGDYSVSMGYNNSVQSATSCAIGSGQTITGANGFAFGTGGTVSGDYAKKIGQNFSVSGDYSIGINLDYTTRSLSQASTLAIMGGKVGIADLTPTYELDVTGDINCTGDFRVNGTVLESGSTVKSGTVEVVGSMGGVTEEVTFNTSFSGTPIVTATSTAYYEDPVWIKPVEVCVLDITTGGFVVYLDAMNGTFEVQWIATEASNP